ncbi:MAG: 5'/3'-nucleotidase SurE [Bacteroidetes bacterium]|nr:5'/3'-nucleotidase SurE [Bacteroidota bacterium]
MKKRPLIFVTNDDGVEAPGIEALIKVMRELGDVKVVAPLHPMSGTGHAVTAREPLRLKLLEKIDGFEKYACTGTPVDCVKLGEQFVIKGKPDLMVSGINHGSNSAVNIVYSGTMAAALESAIGGVPSIGFSLLDYSHDADFSHCDAFIKKITEKVLSDGLPKDICLNVNIPAINGSEIKGIKVCRQARSRWVEDYELRVDPAQKEYFWLRGTFELLEDHPETDEWALRNNYVSVVPVHFDLTAHHFLEHFKHWENHA